MTACDVAAAACRGALTVRASSIRMRMRRIAGLKPGEDRLADQKVADIELHHLR